MIETDDFLADLERHLREAAGRRDERAVRRRGAAGRLLRPRRSAAVALVGVAMLAAVIAIGRGAPSPPPDDRAVATPSVAPSPHADAQGRRIALQAVAGVKRVSACRTAPDAVPPVVDTPLSPAIAKLAPGLASGPGVDPAALRLEPMTARGVLRSSARRLPLGSGLTLTAYVLDGLPAGDLADPAGCLRARLARAASLSAAQPAAVQRAAERNVREFRESALDLQTLMLMVASSGQQGAFGAGLPAWSGHTPGPGVAVSGGLGAGIERSAYVGIADPRATHVVVHTRKPFTVPVKQGFYGLVLTGKTGRVMLDETAADGTVLATRRVR